MTSSTSSTLLCPVCSGENSLDSRFCRHCGHTLVSAGAEAISTAAASVETVSTPVVAAPVITANSGSAYETESLSSPGEIDGRRARQLLDRAQYLSERGDIGGAILACRQSIALAPNEFNGHSMLGLLLERSGDISHAVTAYEKAVQLAPDSPLERDNLVRVQEKLQESKSNTLFQFNDEELFADTVPAPSNDGLAPKTVPLASPSPVNQLNGQQTAQTSPSGAPVVPKAAPPVVFERRVSQRRRFNTPITIERRNGLDRRAVVGAVAPVARVAPVVPPIVAATPVFQAPVAAPPTNPWADLWSRPSYFGRSLPLAGVTVLALALLSWARSAAIARAVDAQMKSSVAITPADPTLPATAPIINPSTGLPPLAPVGATQPQSGGFPISNRQAPARQAGAPFPSPSNAGNPNAGSANGQRLARGPRSTAPNRVTAASNRTPRLSPLIPPAAIPPARINSNAGSNRNSDPITLPAPNIAVPAPAEPPVNVLPSGSSSPLNPAGSSGRGYVRITQGRIGTSALPQRPSSQSNNDERSAANAARNGQNDQAIDRLTASINASSSDAGFRYQQRATLFLNRGDYSRAADDFQAAISAYNAQINRGEQVAEARAGLRAARSGLNLALSGGR